MSGRRTASIAALAAALALVGAACTDDEPEIDEDADQELVDDVALTLDDLPDGFEEEEQDTDDENELFDACGDVVDIDVDDVQANNVAEAGSDVRFTRSTATAITQVVATVTAFRDAGLATSQLAAFEDDDFFDCASEVLEDQVGDDPAVTEIDVERGDPAVEGDAVAAVDVEIVSDGVTFELQNHFVLVDRFGIVLQVLAGPDGVDDDLVDDAFDAMLDRLEDAQE